MFLQERLDRLHSYMELESTDFFKYVQAVRIERKLMGAMTTDELIVLLEKLEA